MAASSPTGDLASLWQLTVLQRLRLDCTHCTGSWPGPAALSRLQRLELRAGAAEATTTNHWSHAAVWSRWTAGGMAPCRLPTGPLWM